MILLTSTADLVQLVTSAAQNTDVHASWVDNLAGNITPGRTNTPTIATATTTTIIGSPAGSTSRAVKAIYIRNRGSAAQTVTPRHTDGTTIVQLISLTLAPGEELHYEETVGWRHYDVSGAIVVGNA